MESLDAHVPRSIWLLVRLAYNRLCGFTFEVHDNTFPIALASCDISREAPRRIDTYRL